VRGAAADLVGEGPSRRPDSLTLTLPGAAEPPALLDGAPEALRAPDSDAAVAAGALEACIRASLDRGGHNRRLLFSACMELATLSADVAEQTGATRGSSVGGSAAAAASHYLRMAARFAAMLRRLVDGVHRVATPLAPGAAERLPEAVVRSVSGLVLEAAEEAAPDGSVDASTVDVDRGDDAGADARGGRRPTTAASLASTVVGPADPAAVADAAVPGPPETRAQCVAAITEAAESRPQAALVFARAVVYALLSLRRELLLSAFCSDEQDSLATELHESLLELCSGYRKECCCESSAGVLFTGGGPEGPDGSERTADADGAEDADGTVRVQWYTPEDDPSVVVMYSALGRAAGKVETRALSASSLSELQLRLSDVARRLRVAAFAGTASGNGRRGGSPADLEDLGKDFEACLSSAGHLLGGAGSGTGGALDCDAEVLESLVALFDIDVGADTEDASLCAFLQDALSGNAESPAKAQDTVDE
jgi:hypothetical protein